jgi:hypothetical protein
MCAYIGCVICVEHGKVQIRIIRVGKDRAGKDEKMLNVKLNLIIEKLQNKCSGRENKPW